MAVGLRVRLGVGVGSEVSVGGRGVKVAVAGPGDGVLVAGGVPVAVIFLVFHIVFLPVLRLFYRLVLLRILGWDASAIYGKSDKLTKQHIFLNRITYGGNC